VLGRPQNPLEARAALRNSILRNTESNPSRFGNRPKSHPRRELVVACGEGRAAITPQIGFAPAGFSRARGRSAREAVFRQQQQSYNTDAARTIRVEHVSVKSAAPPCCQEGAAIRLVGPWAGKPSGRSCYGPIGGVARPAKLAPPMCYRGRIETVDRSRDLRFSPCSSHLLRRNDRARRSRPDF
jgi:hypothetical protein